MPDNVTKNEYIAVRLASALIGLMPQTNGLGTEAGRESAVSDALAVYKKILTDLEAGKLRR